MIYKKYPYPDYCREQHCLPNFFWNDHFNYYPNNIAGMNSYAYVQQHDIYLETNKENVYERVRFPYYLAYVSNTVGELIESGLQPYTEIEAIPIPYSHIAIKLLEDLIKKLPEASRNIYGDPTLINNYVYGVNDSVLNLQKTTILVNPIIRKIVGDVFEKESRELICEVYDATFYLQIPSLKNGIANYIADQMTPFLILPLAEPGAENIEYIRSELKNEWGCNLSNEEIERIIKYIYLNQIKTREFTVSDQIGLQGQAGLNGKIDYSKKGLTSYTGLDLIVNKNEVKELDLSNNYILGTDFDPDFSRNQLGLFINLERLNLEKNQLGTFPNTIFNNLLLLRYLNLSNNRIRDFNLHEVMNHGNLETLVLANNNLTSLQLGNFNNSILKVLDLENNNIKFIFQFVTLGEPSPFLPKTLIDLNLKNNNLEGLPDQLFLGLSNLKKLNLADNKLKKLPQEIFWNTPNLKALFLNYNQLEDLPPNIFYGLTLVYLNLRCNRLEENDLVDLEGRFDYDYYGGQNFRVIHYIPQGDVVEGGACWLQKEVLDKLEEQDIRELLQNI